MSSTSSVVPIATNLSSALGGGKGQTQQIQNQSASVFFASLVSSIVIFVEPPYQSSQDPCPVDADGLSADLTSSNSQPRTYLVPEKQRTEPPPKGIWRWIIPVYRTSKVEFVQKCGLDAYFFLRYLWLLLKIFVPSAAVILPVLLPINYVGGKGPNFATGIYSNATTWNNVTGLNQFAFGNVRPDETNRYWAHLILAVGVIVWSCWVFFDELKDYIKLRQAYLTSPQHRLRASATTVLVSGIPKEWCTAKALDGLYDVFPGGIRNIWINRKFDDLNAKIKLRNKLALSLESGETNLVQNAKKAQMKKAKEEAKKAGKKQTKEEEKQEKKKIDEKASAVANLDGVSAGDPHQVRHNIREILSDRGRQHSRDETKNQVHKRRLVPIPLVGQGIDAVGHGLGNIGKTVLGGFRTVGKEVDERLNTTNGFVPPEDGEFATQLQTTGGYEPPEDKTVAIQHDSEDEEGRSDHHIRDSASTVVQRRESDARSDKSYNEDDDDDALWRRYLKPKDRDTMRLPIFGWTWMISLPLIGKKVDTIYYCRKEIARLNVEIEEDQGNPEKFPLMNSAFIQFNHQVAAHMACQSVTHHMPKQMAPRMVEISPDDVIWDNMSITWWESYIRTVVVLVLIIGLVIGWAIPVSFTGTLSQIQYLSQTLSWLSWLQRVPAVILAVIQGLLPQLLLALLLLVLPIILRLLAKNQGVPTGMAVEISVQKFYFGFLFVQVFLIVSISTTITTVVAQIAASPQSIPAILAENIPKAANYFFSYLILQALSVSAGALLQVGELLSWFILGPLLDGTARKKWARQMNLPTTQWGTFFPVFTNLAAIGFIYAVISPLILIFNVITFGLFWIAYRYNSLYVTKFRSDTGGLLFPTAVNQLFVGLYFMEASLIGLFFLVTNADANGNATSNTPCKPQAIIMIIVLCLTVVYQILLSQNFSPLYRYMPITLEDDAVERDGEFARAQEMHSMDEERGNNDHRPTSSGANVEGLEDLTPAERDFLVQRAFQHEALRAKRPVVWIPRDDLGVADDEVYRTQRTSKHIWISDQYTALDSKARVVYRRSPPDFSEVDLIDL
ncbi:hypothetical protein MMC17_007897 [Xylographa soralifera]|nr:hypothetical protein [Xylographa soralifera]